MIKTSKPLLYIHIPFCDSKCFYCSFNSYTNLHHTQDRYIKSLIKQFYYEINKFGITEFRTIYIGGGTPSTLSIKNLEFIFEAISPYFTSSAEITIEANPNSASEIWLQKAKDLGVNRISLGVQSFNSEKLQFLGRNHSKELAINSIKLAEKVEFKNINIDIIYNTIMDSRELLEKDMNIIDNLPISHISLYSLIVEDMTPFANQDNVQNDNLEDEKWLIHRIEKRFPQYEVSNFGKQSEHNSGYWKGENYIGIGSGAVGFWKDKRYYPNKDIEKYIKNPLDIEEEILSDDDLKLESLLLGFRSNIGVSCDILNKNDIKEAEFLVKKGILYFSESENRFFNKNYLLTDEIILQITK